MHMLAKYITLVCMIFLWVKSMPLNEENISVMRINVVFFSCSRFFELFNQNRFKAFDVSLFIIHF